MKKELRDYLRKLGSKGGKARAQSLSREQRREIGKQAAKARWGKRKGQA